MSQKLPLNDFEKSLPHHEMIFVEGGAFMMGGNDEEAFDREKPVHHVQVDSFYMAKFLVTQACWKAVMKGENPSSFQGDDSPVEEVSWEDAHIFLKKLNKLTGRGYRLPSEAEWEYAARGGKYSEEYVYAGSDKLSEVGWYGANSGNETRPVGQLLPNELGLYDLSGNVNEWCEDWYGSSQYYERCLKKGLVENPLGPETGAGRVMRGGGWFDGARFCCVSYRYSHSPDRRIPFIGFRLALSPSQLAGH